MPATRNRATAGGLLAIVLWATIVGFTRTTADALGVFTSTGLCYLVGGLALLAWALASGRAAWPSRRYLVGCGLCFFANAACFAMAIALVERKQVLAIALVNYLWPTLTLVAAVVVLGERATWLLPLGAAVATAGIVIARSIDPSILAVDIVATPLPYLLALAGAIAWALYTTLGRRWAPDVQQGGVAVLMIACGLLLLPIAAVTGESATWSAQAAAHLAGRTACITVAQIGWEVAMRRGDLVLVASASYATPVLSTLFSCALLGLPLGGEVLAGACLVAGGAVLCRWAMRPATGA
jgi:drug/metabolite transporter (DMT)-like permease